MITCPLKSKASRTKSKWWSPRFWSFLPYLFGKATISVTWRAAFGNGCWVGKGDGLFWHYVSFPLWFLHFSILDISGRTCLSLSNTFTIKETWPLCELRVHLEAIGLYWGKRLNCRQEAKATILPVRQETGGVTAEHSGWQDSCYLGVSFSWKNLKPCVSNPIA